MYLLASVLFLCLVKSTISTEYALAKATPGNGEIFQLDIALDNTTMLTYPGKPDPPQDCFKETINLHDFEKRLVAMKIVGEGKCIIKSTTETYEQVKKIVDGIHQGRSGPIKQATEEWVVPKDPIPPEEVESAVGTKISNFCSGYKVFVTSDQKVVDSVRDLLRMARMGKNKARCFLCLFCKVVTQ